jgi:catechol 2,3-dioxygenase-like lactoylglutathione lyase family enzyme
MFDHISIGVKDLDRAQEFYDAALGPLGYSRLSQADDMLGYGNETIFLWIGKVERPVPADMASGLHFCFAAPNQKAVDAFHDAGTAHGGKDNGPPGPRPDYGTNYYAAFVIDPDGYRLEAYYGGPS